MFTFISKWVQIAIDYECLGYHVVTTRKRRRRLCCQRRKIVQVVAEVTRWNNDQGIFVTAKQGLIVGLIFKVLLKGFPSIENFSF